jgi:hypothetical protein
MRRQWRVVLATCAVSLTVGLGAWFAATLPYVPDGIVPYIHGAVAISTVWMIYLLMVQSGGIVSQQVGVMAEEWTAQALRSLQRGGWHIVHDVPMEFDNVDHALIGPGGVLAIETKYRSDWASVTAADVDRMAQQAIKEARDLSFRIGMKGRCVTPIVVVWTSGTSGVLESAFEHDGVKFCPARDLRAAIAGFPTIANAIEIQDRFAQLNAYVVNREIGLAAERGPAPRTMSEIHGDVTAASLTFCAVLIAMLPAASVRPVGLWAALVGSAVATTSLAVRRRYADSIRVRLCATVATATAIGLIATGLILVLVALLQ